MNLFLFSEMVITTISVQTLVSNILNTVGRKEILKAPEEVLLDVDKLAEGHPYYSAVGFSISPDNNKMIYGVDDVSRRQYKLFLKDLSTGKTTDLGIINTTGGATWANDNKTIFYTAKIRKPF